MISADRNFGCRISDQWQLKGLKTVVMENELLRVTILADKGSDIYEFLYKPQDIDFMWRTPMGLRNQNRGLPTNATEAGPFIDYYEGGWQEILPSGGAPCVHKGVAFGQHGEVSNLPWDCRILKDTPEEISCRFTVRTMRTPLRVEKTLTMKAKEAKLFIAEKLMNESPEEVDVMWGHHLAFGEPFLDEHCRIDAPAERILIHATAYSDRHRFEAGKTFSWPNATTRKGEQFDFRKIPPRSTGSQDMAYLLDLKAPWYALTHTRRKVGFGLRWSADVFKYLWYWQVFGGGEGYPWYSRTYNIGLEPWTSMPTSGLAEAVQESTHLVLPPHGEVDAHLLAVVYENVSPVANISNEGNVT